MTLLQRIAREPNALTGLVVATYGALVAFGVLELTVQQTGALGVLGGALIFALRWLVTPASEVVVQQRGDEDPVAGAALGLQWRTGEHYAVLTGRFAHGDAVFDHALAQLGTAFASSHGAQASQVALGQLVVQLNQQATLLASLDYFSFLVVFALVGAVAMMGQRVLR